MARQPQRLEPVFADLNCVVAEMTDLLRRSIGPTIEVRHALAAALASAESARHPRDCRLRRPTV